MHMFQLDLESMSIDNTEAQTQIVIMTEGKYAPLLTTVHTSRLKPTQTVHGEVEP